MAGRRAGQDAGLRGRDGLRRRRGTRRVRLPDAPRGRLRGAEPLPKLRHEAAATGDDLHLPDAPRCRVRAAGPLPELRHEAAAGAVGGTGRGRWAPRARTRRARRDGRGASRPRPRGARPPCARPRRDRRHRVGGRHGRRQPDHHAGQHPLEADRPLHRRGQPRHPVAVHRRRPGEDPSGQRDGLRPSDAPPVPHPRRRPFPGHRTRWGARPQPGLERHGAGAHRGGRRHPARRHQPGALDGALPHRRAPRERNDVQLRRRPGRARVAMTEQHDVIVIGGGQAGLAVGYYLAGQQRRFTILEAAGEPAAAWRARSGSLRLFTPVRRDSLPGRAFPGDPDSYPDRDQVVSYLDDYARHFELPVELDSRVLAVRGADNGFEGELADRRYLAEQVVVATGPFQVPFTPPMASGLAPEVMQMHSTEYRRPSQLPDGPVVVVGGGNTGYQIAEELVPSREVHLAVGARQTPLPQRFLGRDIFAYQDRLGLMRKTVDSRLAQRLKDRETLIGSSPRAARNQGIQLRKRVTGAQGTRLRFAVGSQQEASAVIWATGFRPDHSFVQLPVFGADGRVEHRRGVTAIPGLYFLGLPWLYTRGSALLGWVKDDAQYLADRIAERAATSNEGTDA